MREWIFDDGSMKKILLLLLSLTFLEVSLAKEELYTAKRAIREGNYAEAFCLLKPMATAGHAEAQYQLGWMYHNGYGLAVDDNKAAYWWEKSAKNNMVDADMALVMLYREGGIGVKKNLPKAAGYLLNAAQQGDEEGRMLLSHFMEDADWALQSQAQKILNSNPQSLGPVMYVKATKANLRESPSQSATVIETVGKGEQLVYLARRNEWAHVVFVRQKVFAWVHNDLIGTAAVVAPAVESK